jgi:hypothetical protein
MTEPKKNGKERMARLRKFRKDNGLCVRCGEPNNRLPWVNCKECAAKAAFEHEIYREKRNINIRKELRSLQEQVNKLTSQVQEILNGKSS